MKMDPLEIIQKYGPVITPKNQQKLSKELKKMSKQFQQPTQRRRKK